MEESKHYDPQIGYRLGRLQTVLDSISGQLEEGEPESTDRFLEIGDGEDENDNNNDKNENTDTPAHSMRPKIRHDTNYFHQIMRYLKTKHTEHQMENRIKENASN